MRQLLTLGIFFIALQLFGQKQIVWFDVGIKAQYGGAGFYNSAIGDASNLFDYKIGSGLGYGGRIGINFVYSGLSLEVMKNSASQKFDRVGSTVIDVVEWNSLDLYALFRTSKNLGYFELGPKMTLLDKATTTLEGVSADRTEDFSKNILGGVIGFGANIMGNDGRFSGILGLRFEYGFTDLVGEDGATTSAPVYEPSIYADGYKKSNIAFAGVVFELNWGIGYFGKAQCGARSKFIMF